MIAIILAGGFGTRLKSVVANVPKPMAPIDNKPYLEYLIGYLKKSNITEVVLCLYHQHEVIINYFGDSFNGIKMNYVIEKEPLGTGGAILNAITELNLNNDFYFVLNGDTFVDVDYAQLLKTHLGNNSKLTITVHCMESCSRYGLVNIDANQNITSFVEKSSALSPGYINAGVYCVNPRLLLEYQNNLPSAFSFEQEFLYPYVNEIKPGAYVHKGFFIDIGIPEDYFTACKVLPEMFDK